MDIDESENVMDESVNAYGSVLVPDENAERSVEPEVGYENLARVERERFQFFKEKLFFSLDLTTTVTLR